MRTRNPWPPHLHFPRNSRLCPASCGKWEGIGSVFLLENGCILYVGLLLDWCSNNSAGFPLQRVIIFSQYLSDTYQGLSRVLSGRNLAINERDKTIAQTCNIDSYRFLSYQSRKSKRQTGGGTLGSVFPAVTKPWHHIRSAVEVDVQNASP